jgi:hypothetical protein
MDLTFYNTKYSISYVDRNDSTVKLMRYKKTHFPEGNLLYELEIDNDTFGYQPYLSDAVVLEDFGVYKVQNETVIFFRDRLLKRILPSPVITFGPAVRINFRVQRRATSSMLFDMMACTKNNAPNADIC